VFGLTVLISLAARTYRGGPPIPDRVVSATGMALFTGADILAGQEVFLKYGLMDNGTVWRHGVYLGPDFFRRVSARGRGRPSGQLAAQQGRS
jgi:nitric oxide reductase subunit B